MQFLKLGFFFTITFFAASSVFASGAVGGGGYGGSSGGYSSPAPVRQVDERYEYGKAVFKGRIQGVKAYDYCVKVDDAMEPLAGKTVKNFKKKSLHSFANAIYDCNEPSKLIGNELTREDFGYLMYYLDKRYKLNLQG